MPPQNLDYPTDLNVQLLVGVIFAESATKNFGGGENSDEKQAIGATFVNAAHYAKTKIVGKKKCYNDSLGDGTIQSAVTIMSLAYNTLTWNKIMNGNNLRSAAELAKLNPDDTEHLRLSIEAAKALEPLLGPKLVLALGNKIPAGFNKAADSPPSSRMERLGKLGAHTFYGFKMGRECQ